MQDNLHYSKKFEDKNKNIEENIHMINMTVIDLSDKQKEEWREVFEKLLVIDNNKSGEIDIEKLVNLIMSLNDSTMSYWWRGGMPLERDKLTKLFSDADNNKNGSISVCEFYELWAADCPDICRDTKEYIAESLKTVVLAKNIKKCPPPLFLPLISLVQIVLFINNQVEASNLPLENSYNSTTTFTGLIFQGNSRSDGWTYLSYSLVHRDLEHLLMVLLVQLVLGMLMEMVHGSIRIALIYLTGVFTGSLSSYVFSPGVHLVGGSGGCYSLLGAHLATLVLNWVEDHAIILRRVRGYKTPKILHGKLIRNLKLLGLVIFIIGDLLVFYLKSQSDISYVAHVFGFIVGYIVAFIVTRNRVETSREKYFKIILSVILSVLFIVGIILIFG